MEIKLNDGSTATLDSTNEELLSNMLTEGVLETVCLECGNSIRTEPDADDAWCETCDKVTKVYNPMF